MYKIEFLPTAKKELSKLDKPIQSLLKNKIIQLASNPDILKNNIKPLKGEYIGTFRLRVKQYRIIFQVKESQLIILIVRIGHRKEVY